MKFGLFDWLGRVIMLALAGMITLSIIGAIAAIPSGSIETRMGMEPTAWPEPSYQEPRPAPPPRPQPEAEPEPVASAPAPAETSAVVAAPAPREEGAERWLESITYILLALAGIAAFGTILLWRALGHWRRSADALEAIAAGAKPHNRLS
jgi:hypothetical protein